MTQQHPISLKQRVKEYWTRYPCALEALYSKPDTKRFYQEHDALIDRLYPYGREILDYRGCRNKQVLEIGCGMGSHSHRMALEAKHHTALELNPHSLRIAQQRFDLFDIRKVSFLQGDAETLPFKSNSFDRIYSLGVIHHTPETEAAIGEMHRTLRPGGDAIIMVYHRNSIFYWWKIMTVLQFKLRLIKVTPSAILKILDQLPPWKNHPKWRLPLSEIRALLRAAPLTVERILSTGTDGFGLHNPLSKTYTQNQIRSMANQFENIKFDIRGSWDRWEDRIRGIEKRFGWFLYIKVCKAK